MKFFLSLLLSLFIAPLFSQQLFDSAIANLRNPALKPFYFGVASGDPHQNSVIIWTKIWSDDAQPVKVKWEIASDTLMKNIVSSGEEEAVYDRAFTVKITVKNLEAGKIYFYRFESGNIFSPVGRTKTAPANANDIRFAVVSCANYEQGFYNAYRLIAERNDLDAVIHLGDYMYEYGARKLDGKKVVRTHIPVHECVSLQDYRSRYAEERLDVDLQEAHRLTPFITEWDDHEFANDAYKDGAKNHQPDKDGDWETRKRVAKQAYFEWLPITDNADEKITREISYGNLADIFMLDGRTEGRSKQGDSPTDPVLKSENQTMLGKAQSDWLIKGVENSSARWKIISNQTVFSELDAHRISKKYSVDLDAWDGYPVERKKILDSFYAHNAKNIVIVTGDIHSSFAFDLAQDPKNKQRYNRKTGKGVIGAEFVAPSISSNGAAERFPKALCKFIGSILKEKINNPHMRFQNLVNHGYILLDLNNDRAKATWEFCKTVRERSDKRFDKDSWISRYNDNRLVKAKKE